MTPLNRLPAPSPVRLSLVCVDDFSPICQLEVPSFPSTVGRGEQADLRFADCWASRVHCRLEQEDGRVRVIDLNSGNGTFLNGQPITRAWLKAGDHLTIGITTFEVNLLPLDVDECESSLSGPEFSSL